MGSPYASYFLLCSGVFIMMLYWMESKKPNLKKIIFKVKVVAVLFMFASLFVGFYSEQAYLIVLSCAPIALLCGVIYAFRYQPKDDKIINKE